MIIETSPLAKFLVPLLQAQPRTVASIQSGNMVKYWCLNMDRQKIWYLRCLLKSCHLHLRLCDTNHDMRQCWKLQTIDLDRKLEKALKEVGMVINWSVKFC